MYTCRECEQPINPATEVCPYCGADLAEVSTGMGSGIRPQKSSPKILIALSLISASIAVIAWFAFPWRMAGSKSVAEAHGIGAIGGLQKVLSDYQATEGTFPSSLESLGPAAATVARNAQSGRYTLQYTPGSPDAQGRVRTYTLTARAGNYGYLNLFADETGIIRVTREDRAATAQDPPIQADPIAPVILSFGSNP